MTDHGTGTMYKYGCRCPKCKTAQNTYIRGYRARRRQQLMEDDPNFVVDVEGEPVRGRDALEAV